MNPETYLSDWQSGWNSFLSAYFDGNDHNFGGSAITFPDCDISFSRPQISEKLSKPLINLMIMSETTSVYRTGGSGGRYKMVTQPTLIHVFTADHQGLWDVNDNIQNKLDLVLGGDAATLAGYGLKFIGISEATKINYDSSHEFQVSQRTVRTRQELEYPLKD